MSRRGFQRDDEERSGFTPILEDLIRRCPGLVGAVLVAPDGESVDYAGVIAPYQLKLVAAHMRIVWGEVEGEWSRHSGEVGLVAVRAQRSSFIVRALCDGYALVLVLARHGLRVPACAMTLALARLSEEAGWDAHFAPAWHPVEVQVGSGKHDGRRPKRVERSGTYEDVEVLGILVGIQGGRGQVRKGHGYRVRLSSGAELTLVREPLGHWYSDEPVVETS